MSIKKRALVEKAINVILDLFIVLFGIILLITIYCNIQVKVLKNSYPSFFGYSVFEVKTNSMADAINAGDWIIVKYSSDIANNDIITFEQDGNFITHRVVESYQGTYVTMGDANNAKDEPISKDQIVGKVVKILPNFGIFRYTIFNMPVLVAFIITLYLVGLVLKTKKKAKPETVASTSEIKEKAVKNIENIAKKIKPRKKVKKVVKETKKEIEPIIKDKEVVENQNAEDDLDKTMLFRMVSVDEDEIENSYLRAANNVLENENRNEKSSIDEEEQDEEVSEDEATKKLELLSKKKKKFGNIIEKVFFIKREELNEIIDVLNSNKKFAVNEATIKDTLLDVYIDGKYYNFCGDVNVEYDRRNMRIRLASAIDKSVENMIKSYKGSDKNYAEKAQKFKKIFSLITELENSFVVLSDVKTKREDYKNRINKYEIDKLSDLDIKKMANDIIKVQRLYSAMTKSIIKKFETNTFELNYNSMSEKKMYGLELDHNIAFSKVYSEYIVDKSYSEGIVAEDKVAVILSLLLPQIVKDMYSADFNKKYVIYMPSTLYEKDNKLKSTFGLFDDEYAKHSIIVLIDYDTLAENKKSVRNLIKEGYRFAVNLDETMKVRDQGIVELMDYIFIDKYRSDREDILKSLPKEYESKVIYENIFDKVGK